MEMMTARERNTEETEMTRDEARMEFDKMIAKATTADQIAKLELMREFFCNSEFRQALEDETARQNGL